MTPEEQKVNYARKWRFAKFVAARRAHLGLTQVQFARRSNTSERIVQYVETGERWPQMQNFILVCEGLGMKPSDVLKEIGL